jgi:DNA-binding transcriptional MerR regulator
MRTALHIGEAAHLLGVTPKTIRHYHKVGLLAEPERSDGGYRLYTASDLLRLLRIRRLQALGLSLKQVKTVLGEPDQTRTLREVFQALLADLAAQIEALEARRGQIQRLLEENALEAMDEPTEMPALLQWAQIHLGEHLPQVSAEIWKQDARAFARLEAFRWPAEVQAQLREAIQSFAKDPQQFQYLLPFVEQVAALASAPEDSPEIECLAEQVARSAFGQMLQAAAAESVPALESPLSEVFGEVLLSAYSPAQQRFLALLRQYLTPPTKEKEE